MQLVLSGDCEQKCYVEVPSGLWLGLVRMAPGAKMNVQEMEPSSLSHQMEGSFTNLLWTLGELEINLLLC